MAQTPKTRARRRFLAGMGALALSGTGARVFAQPAARIDPGQPYSRPPTDLNLVLAVDCSSSIDAGRYRLQAQGYAAAFRNERVRRAVLSGREKRIGIAMTQWGGQRVQHVAVDWTLLDGRAALDAFAARLAGQPRLTDDDATAVGAAIDHARGLLQQCPFAGTRQVIDISGDGASNQGKFPRYARDEAVALDIGINGLPILTLEPNLDAVYRAEVIGGPGAFVVPVRRFEDFAAAIANKLVREIA